MHFVAHFGEKWTGVREYWFRPFTITDSVLSIRAKKRSRNHITETSRCSTSRGVVEW